MLLLRDADFVITVDGARRVLRQASIVIDGSTIAAIGKTKEIDDQYGGRIAQSNVIDCLANADRPRLYQYSRAYLRASQSRSDPRQPSHTTMGAGLFLPVPG